jgi:hypothetical protein
MVDDIRLPETQESDGRAGLGPVAQVHEQLRRVRPVQDRPSGRVRARSVRGVPGVVRRRAWTVLWLRHLFGRILFGLRIGPGRSSAVGRLPTWRGSRRQSMARFATFAVAVIFAAWFGRALYVVISGDPHSLPFDVDKVCQGTTYSCNVVSGSLAAVLTLGLVYLLFLLRLAGVQRRYLRLARSRPAELVQDADRAVGPVVGRDALCHVLITNLRNRATRQPQVVVGSLGAGKTTVLVQLTKLLAKRGVIAVPINLRNAQDNLDFRALALHQFLEATGGDVADANAIKNWRQLCEEDKVVVLADALEEALVGAEVQAGRDYSIRLAIVQAAKQKLPLIITSRPHDPLRQLHASTVQLEPLGEEAMLEYLQRNTYADGRRLDWIVQAADPAEEPIYLQITRELDRQGLLDHPVSRDGGRLDTRRVDRAEVRLRLLDAWIAAHISGHFAPGVPLSRDERAATVEQLSVLACIGLERDRLVVTFGDFEELFRGRHPVIEEAGRRLADLGSGFDIRLAAIFGTQLGLVEARGEGVRFPRPVVQAYLGSRLIGAAMDDPEYRRTVMWLPGREFLTALVFHSRARVQHRGPIGSTASAASTEPSQAGDWQLQGLLVDEAMRRDDAKMLDLYATALQTDCVDQTPVHNHIAERLTEAWPIVHAPEPGRLEEAKLNLVHRFGEAARTIAERYPQGKQDGSAKRHKREQPHDTIRPAYRQLYRISYLESSNSIRMAGAQEIGAGGDEAFSMLEGVLRPRDDADGPDGRTAPQGSEETTGKASPRPRSDNAVQQEDHGWRELILRAWVAPLLAGSVTDRATDARDNLERWLQFVGDPARAGTNSGLRLSLEVALAQGFKYAANRRLRHPQARPEARVYLLDQATEMLRNSRFWFCQLTLLHALCLWSLPDSPVEKQAERSRSHPSMAMFRWADMLERPHHPFIVETQRLVNWALDTGLPERFIWIDEKDVWARTGSYPTHLRPTRNGNLWIPPTTGWTVLHPRAQNLLADILDSPERGPQVIE